MIETFTSKSGSGLTLVTPDPKPAPPPCRAGGTPRGPSNSAGVTAMDGAYGGAASVSRLFYPGALGAVPAPATDGRLLIASFTAMDALTPGVAAPFGWLTLDHEINRKTVPTWSSDMAKLQAIAPGRVCVILTAGAFEQPDFMTALKPYILPGITHIGVDMDGVSFPDHYHSYGPAVTNVVAFCKAYGLTWGVAEHGAKRALNDPDGSGRAAWLTSNVRTFRDAGAQYCCLWEQDGPKWPGMAFTTPIEVATVSTIFALCR